MPALCWDLGGTQMKFRIIQKKLEFLWHLINLENGSLAKEILIVQQNQKLPGLVRECLEYFEVYTLPNIFEETISKQKWKSLIKKSMKMENEKDLKELKCRVMKNYEIVI